MKIRLILLMVLCVPVMAFASTGGDAPTCAKSCHIIQPYEASVENPELLINAHSKEFITCIDCHNRDEQMVKDEEEWYQAGDYDDPMYTREPEASFCLRCHENYNGLAKRTRHLREAWDRNPHDSHLGDVDCSLCHKVHQPSQFACSECHHANWGDRLPVGWIPLH